MAQVRGGLRARGRAGLLGFAAALAALAHCGSGEAPPRPAGTDPPILSESAAERENDPRPVVVAFGDSLTAGLRLAPRESYPGLLQEEFDRRGLAFRVVNEGVSGDTTVRGLSRVDSVLARDPQWVILALGANDGLRGLPLDAMEANLRAMIERFQAQGIRVILAGMKLPRNYGPEYVRAFDGVYPRLARELEVPLIPFLLENVAMERELNQPDGIHPNAKGNAIIARQVADAFEALSAE